MKVEQRDVRYMAEPGSFSPRILSRDRLVLIEDRQFLVPPDTHRIEPGVFLRIGDALDLEPKPIFALDRPTAYDDLEHQIDAQYRGARRTGLPQIDISKEEKAPKEEDTTRIVSAKVAEQEDIMWSERDDQISAEDSLTEAFGRIEAEQFLGRALTPEEPLWPVGLFFDYDALWGNTSPSIGKKMHQAGIPQRTLVTSGK